MAISTVAKSGLTTFDKFQRTGAGNTPATGVFVMAGNNSSVSNYATSADDFAKITDKSAWYQANPALGYLIDESTIEEAVATNNLIRKEKEYVIEFNAQGGSSVLGRLKRLLFFPIVWVLTGKAEL